MATNVEYIITLRDKFSSTINKVDQSAGRLGKTMSNLGSMASSALGGFAIGTAVAAGVQKSISLFADYESQMSTVKAITNATGEEFDLLKKQAIDLGSTTAFTATEAGQAMEFLGMAGFTTEQIMSAMPATLDLAAAGSVSLAEAADIASNILSGMGMSADETSRVVDVMAKTATAANTNITDMGEAFKQIAPTLNVLKAPVEDGAAAIALLANSGIKGTDATTSLNTALGRLSKPTALMQKKMKELNLEYFDAQGEFIGMEALIRKTNEATKDLTTEQKLNAVSTIFGAHANKQFTALLNSTKEAVIDGQKVVLKGADAFAYYTDILENSTGTAAQMAETKLDNLKGSWVKLQSAVSGVIIKMVGQAGGGFKKIVDLVTEFVSESAPIQEFFIDLKNQFSELLTSVAAIFTPIIELLQSFGLLQGNLSGIVVLIKIFTGILWLATAPLKAVLWLGTQFAKIIGGGIEFVIDKFKDLVSFIAVVAEKLGFDDAAKKMKDFANGTKEVIKSGGLVGKMATNITRGTNEVTSQSNSNITNMSGTTSVNNVTPTKPTTTAITGVQNQSPKSIVINIDKLVEEFTVSTVNLSQGMAKIQEIVTQTILQGVNDASMTIEGQ
jgi:TP901 family phage tail tape measure protein